MTIMQPQENAIIYDNGKHNGYRINFELMNTKAYHDRFENLTKHKAVNEELYKQAIKILGRRSGTEYEEVAILDARTGELLVENADLVGIVPAKCILNQEQKEYLEKLGKSFVSLHNHPNSSFPSPSDIGTLFVRELQVGSTIICHNGSVYHLEKLKPFNEIDLLLVVIERKLRVAFPTHSKDLIEAKVSREVIKQLSRKGILTFKEVS